MNDAKILNVSGGWVNIEVTKPGGIIIGWPGEGGVLVECGSVYRITEKTLNKLKHLYKIT